MTRSYDAPGRAAAAAQTRQRVLDTARLLLLEGGYARMTIAHLAHTAGVSAQTVYNSVGGKAEVVKAVWDRMLAGDAEPVAMSDRPEFRTLAEAADVDAWSRAYAAWVRGIGDRIGPLAGALLAHGPGGDAGLEEFVSAIDSERRIGNRNSLRGLAERGLVLHGAKLDRLVDAVWVLSAPEVYDRLVRRAGWSSSAYEAWLAGQLRAAIDTALT